ncbi:LPP20 family lipoprotein [Hydrogenimonas sp.]
MRRGIWLALMMAAVTAMTGCGSKNPDPDGLQSECTVEGQAAPRWVCGLHHDDAEYAAVGMAKKSKLGFGFMREEALADARANLAQQAALDVKARTTKFARSTGVGDAETVERVVETVTKQVSRVTLHDARQAAYWENPANGDVYLLVKVAKDKLYETAKEAVKSSFGNDEALWQQMQAKGALEALDEEFPTGR